MVPRKRKPDGRRRLSLAALLALVLHAIFLPLLAWLLFAPLIIPRNSQPPERVTVSSAARMEKTNRPEPPNIQKPVIQQVAQPKPVPSSAPPKRELAKLAPKAPPQPPKANAHPSFGQELAQQEAQFAKTAQRLHAANNPLSVATPYRDPSSTQRSYVNAMGQNHQETYYAVLTPTKHWFDGNSSCYYTTYNMRTSAGGEDDGDIPWPVCYPKNHDAMLPLDRPHDLPVPYPPSGYTLAPGTYLTPFMRSIYDGHIAPP